MMVVSDTSPICYLLLIDEIELLPSLYEHVLIPQTVYNELAASQSPSIIREWIQQPPEWLNIETKKVSPCFSRDLEKLDPGEIAAILLAEQKKANLLIIDDLLGRQAAKSRGINVTGLLGVLDEGARQNLVNFSVSVSRLQTTTFRVSSSLVQSLLQKHQRK